MATLTVQREKYVNKDKKEYYGYFVEGKVRNRLLRANLMAQKNDFGGYETLDTIFDIAPTATLVIKSAKSESASGIITEYKTYEVQNTDEDGIIYSYKLKPRAESDKSTLDILLQLAKRAEEKAEEDSKAKDEKPAKTTK